jgi:hypothetical protein
MQPHSMCAVALAAYVWNRPRRLEVTSSVMNVEYYKNGRYKLNKYELSNFIQCTDGTDFRVHIMRSGGGIACDVTVRRFSLSEGTRVEMTHSQQHVAGLREEFRLMKKRIINGRHYNSQRYRNFEGEAIHPDRKRFKFYCEVKQQNGYFVELPYELEIKTIYTK